MTEHVDRTRQYVPLGGVRGVRIAKNAGAQHGDVPPELRFRIQRAAGVIEVDLTLPVEPPIFGRAQLVQRVCFNVVRILRYEVRLGGDANRAARAQEWKFTTLPREVSWAMMLKKTSSPSVGNVTGKFIRNDGP